MNKNYKTNLQVAMNSFVVTPDMTMLLCVTTTQWWKLYFNPFINKSISDNVKILNYK